MTDSTVSAPPTPSASVTSPDPPRPSSPETSPTAHRYREAYDRATALAESLSSNDLIAINIDVPSAIKKRGRRRLPIRPAEVVTFTVCANDTFICLSLDAALALAIAYRVSDRLIMPAGI
jgi:hypothetical protein